MEQPPPPRGPGCISRRLALLLLLLSLLHLPGAQPSSSSSRLAALSGSIPTPPPVSAPAARNPSGRNHGAAGTQRRLKTETLPNHIAKSQQPPVPAQSHPRFRDPQRHHLNSWQHGHGPLHQLWWMVAQRQKRHAAARLHHIQLMRVGCALGTCQVQNLSHRLWQLMGQSGRHDASPMNPNSPHSYG